MRRLDRRLRLALAVAATLLAMSVLVEASTPRGTVTVLWGACMGGYCRLSFYNNAAWEAEGAAIVLPSGYRVYTDLEPGFRLAPGYAEAHLRLGADASLTLVEGARSETVGAGSIAAPPPAAPMLLKDWRLRINRGYLAGLELPHSLCGQPAYLVVRASKPVRVDMKLFVAGSTLAIEWLGVLGPRGVAVPLPGQKLCYTRLTLEPLDTSADIHASLYAAGSWIALSLYTAGGSLLEAKLPLLPRGEAAVGG